MIAAFLEDFAKWLAGKASLAYGTDIFMFQFPQAPGTQSYVNVTGGAARGISPIEPISIQIMTRAATPAAAQARAEVLYNVFYAPLAARRPIRMEALSADWRANSIDAIQRPYNLGPGEDRQFQCVFNLQVRAACIATS